MAVLSKPLLRQRLSTASAKSIVNDLTSLYLQNRTRISRAVYLTLFVALINRVRNAIAEQKASATLRASTARSPSSPDATGRKKVELNREFFKSLLRLLRICIPGWKSKELRLIISHSVFLVLRTMISLYVAELDGRLVSSLVRGRGREFLTGLVWWMCVAVPATFTNSMVCFLTIVTMGARSRAPRSKESNMPLTNEISSPTTSVSCRYSTERD